MTLCPNCKNPRGDRLYNPRANNSDPYWHKSFFTYCSNRFHLPWWRRLASLLAGGGW